MCVIIYVPRGRSVPDSILEKCWETNDDGGGIMYAASGKVVVSKGHMTLPDLKSAIASAPKKVAMYIHMRIATSGGIRPEMCHPFQVHPTLAIAHNGVISGIGNTEESDTAVLARTMAGLTPESYRIKSVIRLIDALLQGSRLAILHGNGESYRLGSWHKENGLFFSNLNHTFKKYTYVKDDDDDIWEKWRSTKSDESKLPYAYRKPDKCEYCHGEVSYFGSDFFCNDCGLSPNDNLATKEE